MAWLRSRQTVAPARPRKPRRSVRGERLMLPGHMGRIDRYRLLRCTASAASSRDFWARVQAVRAACLRRPKKAQEARRHVALAACAL